MLPYDHCEDHYINDKEKKEKQWAFNKIILWEWNGPWGK